jgi:hypothetical protein
VGAARSRSVTEAEVLTVDDALGFLNMSRNYFYSEVGAGRIRTFLRGRLRMVTRTALNEYVVRCEQESINADGSPKKDLGVIGKGRGRPKKEKVA